MQRATGRGVITAMTRRRVRMRFKHAEVETAACANTRAKLQRTGATGRRVSAATPGSARPSSSSSEAPPPVLTWLMAPTTPAFSAAATESPPPTIVVAPYGWANSK